MKVDAARTLLPPRTVAAPPPPAETPVETPAEIPAEPSGEPAGKTRGVIRNLLAGHYQGVADVRLRMNFHDELQSLESGPRQEAAADKVGGLLASVETRSSELLAAGTLDQESAAAVEAAVTGFQASVGESLGSFDGRDAGALVTAIGSARETVLASLREIDGGESAEALQAFVDGLEAFLSEAAVELDEALARSGLPELSEPRGNGVAYAKFLEQYRALTGTGVDVSG